MSDPESPDERFEALLKLIRSTRGFDFTGYKRSTLRRRFQRRMQVVNVEGYDTYGDYLQAHPDEFTCLFNTILINVTGFFRDADAWEYVSTEIIPRILSARQAGEPVRAWSAGCASGEEAYTIAILLAEALGEAAFREHVKIYATDVDEEALTQARHAVYDHADLAAVPEALREKYFECGANGCAFRKDLRRAIIFGRHDLMKDAPISRVDLLVCRNTLMYFLAEAQARILTRLHFAMAPDGFLFLGRAEMLLTHGELFAPVDLRRRVFVRATRTVSRDRIATLAAPGDDERRAAITRQVRIREAAFDAAPIAQLVLDPNRALLLANERARSILNLTSRDLGRPVQESEALNRLRDLRGAIDHSFADRRPFVLRELEWSPASGEARFFDVHVVPLFDPSGALVGGSIALSDVTEQRQMQATLRKTHTDLETAYEALQSANEELETTNEELQSTTEELETTNEELQSTNEELETMNEELQSTNEELETVNGELRQRSDEVGQANAFLQSILTGLRSAVVVMDREMRVQVWSPRAEDLWGVRSDEVVGQHFMNLDIGLPVEQLRQLVRASLSGETYFQETTLRATNRRGKAIEVKVTCTPLLGPSPGETSGAILLLEEVEAAEVGFTDPDAAGKGGPPG